MCYHISNENDAETLQREFRLPVDKVEQFKKKYDFVGFEKPYLPVISIEDPKRIDMYRWGLLPANITDEKAFKFNTLNANNHELFKTDKMWHRYVHNRCLVLCTGFFEPHYPDLSMPSHKESWYVKPRGKKYFALAGIYSVWKGIKTFSIVTKDASPLLADVHNNGKRQPLILTGDAALAWLIPGLTHQEIGDLTYFEYPDQDLIAYRTIDGIYNAKVDTNVPAAIKPFNQQSSSLGMAA